MQCFGGNKTSGPIDVSTALLAQPGSGWKGDFESETFVAQVAHTLRGEGFDASEDGTGRGTPLIPVVAGTLQANGKAAGSATQQDAEAGLLVPVAFDTTQITSAANYSNPQPGDPCHPLAAGAHPPAIAFPANLSGTQHASTENLAPAMGAKNPTAVAHVQVMPTMTAGGPADTSHNQVSGQMRDAYMVPTTTMQVRRLTPREAERLQGFQWLCAPDYPGAWQDEAGRWWSPDYTAIPWRKKTADLCPDGPRYKALGNSWAIPAVRWIGRRIAMVDSLPARSAA